MSSAASSACRLFDRVRHLAKQPRHLGGRLEIALGIGGEPPAGLVDGQMLADAGEHVLQFAPVGVVIEHVVDGDQRHAGLRARVDAQRKPRAVIAAIEHAGGEPHAAGSGLAQDGEKRRFFRSRDELELWRTESRAGRNGFIGPALRDLRRLSFSTFPEAALQRRGSRSPSRSARARRCAPEDHRAKGCSRPSRRADCRGEQAAEPSPGGTVARIGENVGRAVGEDEPRARVIGQRQLLLALDQVRAHDAGDRVAVGTARCRRARYAPPAASAPRHARRRAGTRNSEATANSR